MCEAIEGIKNDAREEGLKEGFLEALVGLVKDGILTIADAAKRANITVPEFEQKKSIRTNNDLSTDDIRSLHKALLDKGLSGKSVLYVHNVLKVALNKAVDQELIEKNVCLKVKPPAVLKYRHKILSSDQLRTLSDVMKDDPYIPMAIMSARLGLRRGEVLGIKVSDVDFDNNTLAVNRQVSIIKDNSDPNSETSYYGVKKLKSDSSYRVIDFSDAIKALIKNQIKLNEANKERYG